MKHATLKPLTVLLSTENTQQLASILTISSSRSKEGHQLMTVYINSQQKQMRLVTSNPSQTSQMTVDLAQCVWPSAVQFAIAADFVANILTKLPPTQALTLLFTPQGNDLVEISFPQLNQYRHTNSQPAVKAHLQNLDWQSSVSPVMHSVGQFSLLAEQLTPQSPFDIAKLNPDSDKVTVLRSGVVSEVVSPLAKTLNCDAAVTTDVLTSIRNITQSKTKRMGLAQVGDKLLIKTDSSSHVYQIDNIDSLKTAIKTTKIIAAFTTDGIAFKEEINTYQKTAEVKKHQRSYFLVHANRLMISATTENHKMADLPDVIEMKPDNISELYSLHLNDISTVRLQGVTGNGNIVLKIELFSDGTHQLVFYNGPKAYAFIPLLPERETLPEMITLYCDYLEQIGDEQPPSDQDDLIGYGGLLDI